MADDVASFLFDHAIVLMPGVILLGIAAIFLLVRRWPRGLWKRFASALAMAVAIAIASVALVIGEVLERRGRKRLSN